MFGFLLERAYYQNLIGLILLFVGFGVYAGRSGNYRGFLKPAVVLTLFVGMIAHLAIIVIDFGLEAWSFSMLVGYGIGGFAYQAMSGTAPEKRRNPKAVRPGV